MPNRILRLRTVLDRTGLSRTTMYRKIGEGTSRSSCGSASTAPAGAKQRWIAGSPTPPAIAPLSIGADQRVESRRSGTRLSERVLPPSPRYQAIGGSGAAIAVDVRFA